MSIKSNETNGRKINCTCGKMLAVCDDQSIDIVGGEIYLWCKKCKKAMPLSKLINNREP